MLTGMSKIETNDAIALMEECKADQLNKLKGSKNTCKGALLAEYVTVIPAAFDKLIDLLAGDGQ